MNYKDIISSTALKQPGIGATATNSQIYSIQGPTGPTGPAGSGGSGSNTNYTVGPTAPSSPSTGDEWYNTEVGNEFVYINDGDSSQWVEVGSQVGAGASGFNIYSSSASPGTTTDNTLWYNTSVGALFICYQGVYVQV